MINYGRIVGGGFEGLFFFRPYLRNVRIVITAKLGFSADLILNKRSKAKLRWVVGGGGVGSATTPKKDT